MRSIAFIFLFICINLPNYAQQIATPHAHSGLTFTENKGQWNNAILYRAGLDGGALFLEKDRLTFNLYDKYKARLFHNTTISKDSKLDDKINGHAFSVVFDGCNKNSTVESMKQGSYYENYFLNNDPSKWKSNVKNYHQIWIKNLYNHIDYELLTVDGNIKYNLHIMPHGNLEDVKLNYQGINKLQLRNGTLSLKTEFTEIVEQKPYAYQMIDGIKQEVPCEFVLKNKILSYYLPKSYNKNYELVIDPLLVFAAQSGSTADNFGMTATYDAFGNLYSGGIIFDIGYPTTVGAYSASFFGPAFYGNTDVVITKYNSTGNALLFSTYLGGNHTETVNSLIVDKNDNLCFYGVTGSSTFPTTTNAYDNTFNGGVLIGFINNGHRFTYGTDIYVAKFNTTGTTLLASTYIGGSANDGINHSNSYNYYNWPPIPPNTVSTVMPEPKYDSLQYNYGDHSRGEIQLDGQNNIYITSSTRSSDFPTINGFDNTLGGKQDGVLLKFNSNLTNLLYSSFIGGSNNDSGNGLIIDNNDIYITGGTCSADFPYASTGYQTSFQGGKSDGYIIRVNATGNAVLNGTYVGTNLYDQSYFIQSDKQKNIYVYGQSSGDMPILKAVTSSTVFNVPKTHQFISRFDKTLTTLNMSTVFGHDTLRPDISPSAFSVDRCSNIYLSGWGSSIFSPPSLSGMPLLLPTQSTTDGNDFYFMGIDSNATVLKYGSYFGGNISREHVDGGTSRFDPQGKIYQSVCAGCGGNQDFPVTPGAWPGTPGFTNYSSNCNNGVIKIDFQLILAVSTINTNTLSGCAPLTVNYTNANPGNSYLWYLSNGDTTSTNTNPTITYTNPGTYSVSLVVFNPLACNIKDSSSTIVTVYPTPNASFTSTLIPCTTTLTISNTNTLTTNTYLWNWGDSSPTSTLIAPPPHTYSTSGIYTVNLTATSVGGCSVSATQTVSVFNFTPTVTNDSICFGQQTTLTASGGTSYTWSPASSLNNSFIATPIANPTTTTIYSVTIANNISGFMCSNTLTTTVVVFPKITSAFTYSVGACHNNIQFTDASTITPTQWHWNYGDGNTGTSQNSLYYYGLPGTYTVTLIASNQFGCKDTSNQTITIAGFTPVSVSASQLKCELDTVQLQANGGVLYSWAPAQYLTNSTIANPQAFPPTTTIYTVTISTINGTDTCKSQLNTTVNIYPFTYNTNSITISSSTITLGQTATVTLNGFTSLGNLVIEPSVSYTVTSANTIAFTPNKSGEYTIYFTDQHNCKHTLKTLFVEVLTDNCNEGTVFLPTGFTPNGDGTNDVLYIRSNFVSEVYLTIYDRWGEKVFETSDIKIGWDGLFKGKQIDQGVYGYYLTFRCNNGQESFKKGNITLMR